jgi:signal transduction histidine kinase
MAVGAQFVARPIRALVAKARRIGAGDFTGPLPAAQRDELGDLAWEMNAMADQLAEAHRRLEEQTRERIEALEQLRHAERLSTVGRLASGVAHELGTPLNVISGRAQMIVTGEVTGVDVPASAGIIETQARRMAAIIRQLLNLARRPAPRRAATDLHGLVEETLTLLQPLAEKRGIAFEWSDALHGNGASGAGRRDPASETLAGPQTVALNGSGNGTHLGAVHVPVDAEQIRQVVTNLVMNAMQASRDGARIGVEVRRVKASRPGHDGAGDYVCFTVADEGHGIADDVLPHIFEPFFTTKDVGEGTGLGLSVVYGIVEDHSGWIDVRSRPGEGTQFDVYFPAQADT